mmetsp:Transcript_117036/g.335773  ORF Transcript_117036/g.335773 Transcript_117036/m.335773 type:complete len:91 (-) Transcript_117036:1454-1726(-)
MGRPFRSAAAPFAASLAAPLWLGLTVAGQGSLLRGGLVSVVPAPRPGPAGGGILGAGVAEQASSPARSLAMTVRRGDTIVRDLARSLSCD